MKWTVSDKGHLELLVPSRQIDAYEGGGFVAIERRGGGWCAVNVIAEREKALEWVNAAEKDTSPAIQRQWDIAIRGAMDSAIAALRGNAVQCSSQEIAVELREFFDCVATILRSATIVVKGGEQT